MTRTYLLLVACLLLSACWTDGATRIANQIEAKAGRATPGEALRLEVSPKSGSECSGPYTAQFDKVGALIVWCKDAAGRTVSSHSTSYHARFVETAGTFIVDKAAGEPVRLELRGGAGKPVIVDAR